MDQDTRNALANLNTSLDAATQRVQNEAKSFQDRIDALQATIDAGNADPELVAELNNLRARADAIDPTNSTTLDTVAAAAQKANFAAQQQAAGQQSGATAQQPAAGAQPQPQSNTADQPPPPAQPNA
jgi:hypothetical protein